MGNMKAAVNPASFMSGINRLMDMRSKQVDRGLEHFSGVGQGVRANDVAKAQAGGRFEGLSPEKYQNAYAELTNGQSMNKGATINNQNILEGKENIQKNDWREQSATTLFDRQMAKQANSQGFQRAQQGRSQAFSRSQAEARNAMIQGTPQEQNQRSQTMDAYYNEQDPEKKKEILGKAVATGVIDRRFVQNLSDLGIVSKQYRKNSSGGSGGSSGGNRSGKLHPSIPKEVYGNATGSEQEWMSEMAEGGNYNPVVITDPRTKKKSTIHNVRINGQNKVYTDQEFKALGRKVKDKQKKSKNTVTKRAKQPMVSNNQGNFEPKTNVKNINNGIKSRTNAIMKLNKDRQNGKITMKEFSNKYRELIGK